MGDDMRVLCDQVHAKFDAGGKGHLTQSELKALLDAIAKVAGYSSGVKDAQCKAVLEVLDDNNDGEIDTDELFDNIAKVNGLLDFNFQPVFLKKLL